MSARHLVALFREVHDGHRGKRELRTRTRIALGAAGLISIFLGATFYQLGVDVGNTAYSTVAAVVAHEFHDLTGSNARNSTHEHHAGRMRNASPSPIPTPSRSAPPVRAGEHKASPASANLQPPHPTPLLTPTSGNPVGSGSPALGARVSIAISGDSITGLLGVSVNLPDLLWTPTVTVDGRVITQGCQIDWTLFNGTVPVYQPETPCNGLLDLGLDLGLNLDLGDYHLRAKAMLESGGTAQSVVRVQS